MNYHELTSPCGLGCFNCELYLAGQNESLRNSLADKLKVSPDSAICQGCREQSGRVPAIGRNQPCYIFKCAEEHQVDFCAYCSDFPCDYFQPVAYQADQRPHNTKVFNSCLIKKMGLEAWALEKAAEVK